VASVTTRLGTRPRETISPFAAPKASPMPNPTRKTTGIGMPCTCPNKPADRYADSASTDWTDRSTFRLMITMVSPSATSA
jgi:hypothetical protein